MLKIPKERAEKYLKQIESIEKSVEAVKEANAPNEIGQGAQALADLDRIKTEIKDLSENATSKN